jgi:hypothetical protein
MSEIKVNKISPRTACGTTTLGDSGDTFTIPAGVTITNSGTAAGFGATGAASWDTTVKTSGFTAVSGVGYFVNTTAGAISVNLPAGTAGDVVAIKDYANTFDTNAVTLVQNGSDKIGGSTVNATLDVEGIAVTLVFIDSTQGWLVTDSGLQSEAPTATYITATGGTITCCGNYKIHTFTGPGTFTVCSVGNAEGSNTTDYLVIAGGGGGGSTHGGGAGAGGYRESSGCGYTSSPLGACVSALPVSVQGYPIVVGGGGAFSPSPGGLKGVNGSDSSFSSITATGGGGGARGCSDTRMDGLPGGSGSGSSTGCSASTRGAIGSGNTPPVSPPQGNNGGQGASDTVSYRSGGGGGGAAAVGTSSSTSGEPPTPGGVGATSSINGTPTARAGGGGGGSSNNVGTGSGGGGGGGNGGYNSNPNPSRDASTNTGGGGGGSGGGASDVGGVGGSGIVIIRYKFQN